MFSGGAERFNSQPETNLYANLMARKQAKAEAMDQYERSRINSVNDAGLRDIDRKILDDKMSDLRSHYNTNKSNIQKGNSQESFDYEKKFRDVRDFISQSKDRSARHNAALQFYNDRLKQDQRLPDDYMIELHNNDMPIGETYIDQNGEKKEYPAFDILKWSSEAKPFTQEKYVKGFSDIKRTPLQPRYENIPGNPLKQNEVIEEKFDNGAKQVIAARAADRYDNSYSFSSQVQGEIKDPIRRKQLTDVFVQEYGVQPQTPSDYAIAYTMELLQPSVSKVKSIDNKNAIMDKSQAQKQANIKLASSLGYGIWQNKERFKSEAQAAGIDLTKVDADGLFNSAIKSDRTLNLDPTFLGNDPDVKNATNLKLSDDGKSVEYQINYYDKDGKVTESKTLSRPVSIVKQNMIHDLGLKKPSTPKAAEAAPKKKEIKRSDIGTKAAAGGYSQKEYEKLLKQNGVKIID